MPRSRPPVTFDDTTITREIKTPAPALSPRYVVRVVEGPDAGKTFEIDGSQPAAALVGSSPVCEIRLADKRVSRRHASIDVRDRLLRITDLDSYNGTFANGVRVEGAWLRGGETLVVGETTLRIEVAAPAAVKDVPQASRFGRVLGASREMRRLYPLCERLAATNVPVLIEGETGTGKELLAEAIHEEGPRAAKPFVVFDCTAVPPTLVESELFGHERGAFTGAVASRKGVFEQADGGTLLIDEIGDLDVLLQPKLLRALERSEVRRVGGQSSIRVDVRILCATRRDLDHEVQEGRFRDDLFHRLAVARIELPPLRTRRGDIAALARAFWHELGGTPGMLPEDEVHRWEEHTWPGNVRELRNAVARRLALGDLAHFPIERAPEQERDLGAGEGALERILAQRLPFSTARQLLLQEFERGYVERVLAEHNGNVMRAAAASGIARRHFQRVRGRVKDGG